MRPNAQCSYLTSHEAGQAQADEVSLVSVAGQMISAAVRVVNCSTCYTWWQRTAFPCLLFLGLTFFPQGAGRESSNVTQNP